MKLEPCTHHPFVSLVVPSPSGNAVGSQSTFKNPENVNLATAREGRLCAALAVVHYKLGELEQSQDLYARAYDIQVRVRSVTGPTSGLI